MRYRRRLFRVRLTNATTMVLNRLGHLSSKQVRATETKTSERFRRDFAERLACREADCRREGLDLPGPRPGGDSVRQLLGHSQKADYEKDHVVVKLTMSRVQDVDEPMDSRGIRICDVPSIERVMKPELLLRKTLEQPATAMADQKWRTVGSTRAAYAAYLRRVRETGFWALLKVSEIRSLNGIFFIKKKNPLRLRKIIAAVPGNLRCVAPPEVKLPGPWVLSRVHFRGEKFYVGDIDIQSFYTRLMLPRWLWSLFAVLPLKASLLASEMEKMQGFIICSVTGERFGLDECVAPSYCRVPMGWSWGVWVALEVVETELNRCLYADAAFFSLDASQEASGLKEAAAAYRHRFGSDAATSEATWTPPASPEAALCSKPVPPTRLDQAPHLHRSEAQQGRFVNLNQPSGDRAPLLLRPQDLAVGAFIDNIFCFGQRAVRVRRALATARKHFDNIGLVIGDTHDVATRQVEVGLLLDGEAASLTPTTKKFHLLRNACLFLAGAPRHHGRCLQRICGHLAWVLPLNRILFSILGSTYQFIDQIGPRWSPSWGTVREELHNAGHLLWFACTNLRRSLAPITLCTDAEGANEKDYGGGAAVVAPLAPEEADLVLGADWYGKPGEHGGDKPLFTFVEEKEWFILENKRWVFKEPIHLGEMAAVLLAVSRLVKSEQARGASVLLFTDSSVVYYALRKGRSSRYSLRRRCQKLLAWLIAGNLSLDVRWVPSRFCSADGPSRNKSVALAAIARAEAKRQSLSGDAVGVRSLLEPFLCVAGGAANQAEQHRTSG